MARPQLHWRMAHLQITQRQAAPSDVYFERLGHQVVPQQVPQQATAEAAHNPTKRRKVTHTREGPEEAGGRCEDRQHRS